MTNKMSITAPMFAAAVATAIVAAPSASAAGARNCVDGGDSTICQNPGNVEVHTETPRVQSPQIYGPFSSPVPFLFN